MIHVSRLGPDDIRARGFHFGVVIEEGLQEFLTLGQMQLLRWIGE
ncbi:MAG: hypothetical protein ACTSRA_20000 [Promethearchaeota archaeon]